MNLHGKIKARAEYVLPQQSILFRLLDSDMDILYRQGVFLPDIDIAFVGADRKCPYRQSFENRMRVAFKQ